jgi:hypothetical protein
MLVTRLSTTVTPPCQSLTQATVQTPPLTTAGLPQTPAAPRLFPSSTPSKSRLSPVLDLSAGTALPSSRLVILFCITRDPRLCHLPLMPQHWRNMTACSRKMERIRGLLPRPVSTSLPLDLRAPTRTKSLVIDLARAVFDASSIFGYFSSSFSFVFFFTGYQEFKQRGVICCILSRCYLFISDRISPFPLYPQNGSGSHILYSWAFEPG